MKALRKLLILAVVLFLLAMLALDSRVALRRYAIENPLIDHPLRLAVLTDYHGCESSITGEALAEAVEAETPDLILLVGDMFSADGNIQQELALFHALSAIAPCYYVTGNHEYWELDVPALTGQITAAGVTVLDQSCVTVEARGQRINLCGVPDPYAMVYTNAPDTEIQLTNATRDADPNAYTILLAHRPELIETYAANGSFDLVLSGHAHGGQVRIPLLLNGLYAPNQGWFPKYAGGRYDVDSTVMLVSRGLSDQAQMGVPRVFNRPEWLIVELK